MKKILLIIGIIVFPLIFLLAGVVQVKAEPYGWSPDVDNSWKGPPSCGDQKPKAPILYQPNHPLLPKATGKGQIRLQWTKVPGATGYNIYYGFSPKNYIYTAADVGDADWYTVNFLANKTYYFAVQAKQGCAAGPLSNEWYGRPGGGGYYLASANSYAYTPIKKKVAGIASTTVSVPAVIPTAEPTVAPEVQGITTESTQPEYQPPVEEPIAPKAVPTVAPKPKSFWQTLLSIFFGK